MAKRYKKNNAGLRILCVVLALMLAAACTLGGLELWGTGKMKPSEWFKQDDLAPVTISFADGTAPIGAAQTFEDGARAYALTAASGMFPSTKRATATCTLPEGGSPDRYEWEITGGVGLTVKTVNSDGSAADVTAQTYFSGSATLTARAYRDDELRGEGSIGVRAPEPVPISFVFIVLGDTPKCECDAVQFQDQVVGSFPSEYKISIEELQVSPRDIDTLPNRLRTNFQSNDTDINIAVFFDDQGRIARGNPYVFDYLAGEHIRFIVIDDMPYAAERVNAAGGVYFTATEYGVDDMDFSWLPEQAQAVYIGDPDAPPQTAFEIFIDTLFNGEEQICDQEDYNEYLNFIYQYQSEYEGSEEDGGLVLCVPDIIYLDAYLSPLNDMTNIAVIIGNYSSAEYYWNPRDGLREEYGFINFDGYTIYQKRIDDEYLNVFINAVLNFIHGADPQNITPYYYADVSQV